MSVKIGGSGSSPNIERLATVSASTFVAEAVRELEDETMKIGRAAAPVPISFSGIFAVANEKSDAATQLLGEIRATVSNAKSADAAHRASLSLVERIGNIL